MKYLSKCCKAPVEAKGGKKKGSTFWYECTKCNKDCDIICTQSKGGKE